MNKISTFVRPFALGVAMLVSVNLFSQTIWYKNADGDEIYQDTKSDKKITVRKLDESSWKKLGATELSGENIDFPQMVVNSLGRLYLVYQNNINENKIAVMEYSADSNWVVVGKMGFSSGIGGYTSLVLDDSGNLYVAYRDTMNNNKATVIRYDGVNWISVDTSKISKDIADHISITTETDSFLYVVYSDLDNSGRAKDKKIEPLQMVISLDLSSKINGTENVLFKALPINVSDVTIYQQYNKNAPTAGDTSHTYTTDSLTVQDTTYSQMNNYNVGVRSDSLASFIKLDGFSVTGVNGIASSNMDITIYPVPANDVLHIQWKNTKSGMVGMNIHDMNGEVMLSSNYNLEQSNEIVSLPIDQLTPGTYFIQSTINGELVLSQKFVKN